jgi:hypothetical protein
MPPAAWLLAAIALVVTVNGAYQLYRKPSEILGLVLPSGAKAPRATWAEYGPLFRRYSTGVVRPELLAALAQVESSGNPLARTAWRWRASLNPLEIYAPASSAAGLLQLTDAAFAEARELCVRDHTVLSGPACGLTAFSFRAVPSHAIELTSARLHRVVSDTLATQRVRRAPPGHAERLAAVVHLCGRTRGAAFARRGFRTSPGERCGAHDVAAYLARVGRLTATFARLRAAS